MGTGQPHSFACSKCRKSRDFYNMKTKTSSSTIGRRFTTTGKTRPQGSQGGNCGWPHTAYQYRCLGCDHVGWSRHPTVQHVYQREHPEEKTA